MEYRFEIIFLHLISAVVWVGGMISMRFAAHYAFLDIDTPPLRLQVVSHALKRLFYIVLLFVVMLIATGAVLVIGYGMKHTDFYYLAHVKEGIWSVMFINLVAMMIRRSKAERAIAQGDYKKAAALLGPIGKVMVPINIVLGVIAIVVGALLRVNL